MRKALLFLCTILLISGTTGIAVATNIVFSDFSDTSSLTLTNDAHTETTTDGVVLRLTQEQTYSHSVNGSAFNSETINAANFSTYFQFRITEPGGATDLKSETGADGLVFVVQSVSASIGGGGVGLGYSGISPSIGVEFDTWYNPGLDPSSNHIGINVNGDIDYDNNPTVSIGTDGDVSDGFDNGEVWNSWIDYDGTSLEVRISQNVIRPTAAILSRTLDVADILGQETAYVGFTSGTWASWGNHDILHWEYHDSYDPITNPVPEPTTMLLFGTGLIGLAGARRKFKK